MAPTPLSRVFLNFTFYHTYYILIIKKWGSPSSFLSYLHFKLKLRVFLAGHIVAMVTYCATKLTATCSPMIGQVFDINRYRVVIKTHQNLSLGKYWKLF